MNVRWDKGGEAEVVAISIDKISLRSTMSSPPGSRIEGVLDVPHAEREAPLRLRMKVHGCKREEDGKFRIEGRPLDLTRALLDRMMA